MRRLKFYAIDPIKLEYHIRGADVKGKQAEKVSMLQGLKYNVRDWTEEWLNEWEAAFPCVLSTLLSLYPDRKGIDDVPC